MRSRRSASLTQNVVTRSRFSPRQVEPVKLPNCTRFLVYQPTQSAIGTAAAATIRLHSPRRSTTSAPVAIRSHARLKIDRERTTTAAVVKKATSSHVRPLCTYRRSRRPATTRRTTTKYSTYSQFS